MRRKVCVAEEEFYKNKNASYFTKLYLYFTKTLHLSEQQMKQFICICQNEKGSMFNIFDLVTPEYNQIVKNWLVIHSDKGSYYQHLTESMRYMYEFCKTKRIKSLDVYIKHWGVSHLISGRLNENIAFALGLQNVELTKPEKSLIQFKFLRHIEAYKDRFEREEKLRNYIEKNIEKINRWLKFNYG
jgi:hypothetical protein